MRRWISTIIMVLTLFVGEIHMFWHGSTEIQNWIWKAYRPMTIDWNVKHALEGVVILMYFIAWKLYVPSGVNKLTVSAFLWLALMDIFLYFYNFKTEGFGNVYYWFAAFFALSYFGSRFFNWIYRKLYPK